jgi:hypothetical protein
MGLPAHRDPDKRLGSAVTTDSWRVRVSVRGAGLWVLGPGHTRHAPYREGEGVSPIEQMHGYQS